MLYPIMNIAIATLALYQIIWKIPRQKRRIKELEEKLGDESENAEDGTSKQQGSSAEEDVVRDNHIYDRDS
jgi:hypothetical protein